MSKYLRPPMQDFDTPTFLKEKLSWDGFNVVQNNGELAGQTVFHFHMHLIPRYEGDGQHILWKPTEPDAEVLKSIAESLRM